MSTKSTASSKLGLGSLTPEQFENLTFDLVSSLGLHNVNWRTPGADGGRDIEADEIGPDFSGVQTSKRWFIECKKYKGSVDWPTIYGKVAYADSLGAHYLLMCTSAKFTPTAISQVTTWNASHRNLQIRLWPGHELERQLLGHPDILAKFGLSTLPATPGKSFVSLALGLSKSVATFHGSLVFKGEPSDPMLEAAHFFADLLTQRAGDIEQTGRIQVILESISDSPQWVVSGPPFKVDTFAVHAFLGYLSALTKKKLVIEGTGTHAFKIPLAAEAAAVVGRYKAVFDAICLWGELEYRVDLTHLFVTQRTSLV